MRRVGIVALLVLGTVAVYWRASTFDFVLWDDPFYVVDNPPVRAGLTTEGVEWAFSETHGANWHPVTWLAHMLDFELLGDDPGAHHAASVAWHALCTALLFLLLEGATGRAGASALVAALFALHPLHVESVAWVAERKDLVSTAFALLAMMAHVSFARRSGVWRRAAVVAFMALSLMAKPTYVTLPFLLLVLDHWPLARRGLRRLVLEKAPLFALSLAFAVLTFVVQRAGGAMRAAIPLPERLENAVVSYVLYLEKALWPAHLSFHYPHPSLPGSTPLGAATVAASAAILVAISAAVFRSRRPEMRAGWLWYVISLVPTIGVVQVGTQAMADRYSYLPLVGPFWMLAWGGCAIYDRAVERRAWQRPALVVAAAALVAACAVRTVDRLPAWSDSESLLRTSLVATPENPLIQNNLAWLLAAHPDPRRRDPTAALELARQAVAATGSHEATYLDTLSVAYAALGDFDAASQAAQKGQRAAREAGDDESADQLGLRLATYRARRVVRDPTYLRLMRHPLDARPDILVISIDTLRRDAIPDGGADSSFAALAGSGLVFTRAVSPSSWTLPAHASLLTGTYPNVHGATAVGTALVDTVPALAETLREAGYETVAFTDGGFMDAEFGLSRGFDRYDTLTRDPAAREIPDLPREGAADPDGAAPPFDRATAYLASRDASAPPFFLLLHTYRVHDYFDVHPDALARAGPMPAPDPEELVKCVVGAQACDAEVWRDLEKLYRAEVLGIDVALRSLLATLERSGERDRTLVILTSDHGEGFEPGRGRIHHGGRLEADVLDVPMIWSGPGVVSGSSDAPVSLVDVMPTILDHLGIAVPATLQGASLAPVLAGGNGPPGARPRLAMDYQYTWRDGRRVSSEDVLQRPLAAGVVTGPWWYVRSVDGEELYDMEHDAEQRVNLALDDPRYTSLRELLAAKYTADLERPDTTGSEAGEPSPELKERLRALGYAR